MKPIKPIRISIKEIPEEIAIRTRFLSKDSKPFPFKVVEYNPVTGYGIKINEKGEEEAFFHKGGFTEVDRVIDPDQTMLDAIVNTRIVAGNDNVLLQRKRNEIALKEYLNKDPKIIDKDYDKIDPIMINQQERIRSKDEIYADTIKTIDQYKEEFRLKNQKINQQDTELKGLRQQLDFKNKEIGQLKKEKEEKDKEIDELKKEKEKEKNTNK